MPPHVTAPELLVLHTLRCAGTTSLRRLASIAGLPEPDVESELIDLAVAGLVTFQPGEFSGWQLTVTTPAVSDQHLRDLVRLRRVRDRIDREYAQPLDVEALARGAAMSTGHLSREFKRAYGESPYSYLMTRRIERAMALLCRGDLSVTDVCFAVGCQSLGTFSTRFTQLVGVPPSVYRREAAQATAGMPPCVAKQVTRPVRNREAPAVEPQLR